MGLSYGWRAYISPNRCLYSLRLFPTDTLCLPIVVELLCNACFAFAVSCSRFRNTRRKILFAFFSQRGKKNTKNCLLSIIPAVMHMKLTAMMRTILQFTRTPIFISNIVLSGFQFHPKCQFKRLRAEEFLVIDQSVRILPSGGFVSEAICHRVLSVVTVYNGQNVQYSLQFANYRFTISKMNCDILIVKSK